MRINCKTGEPTTASDGLPARCVGQWSKDKVEYISKYAGIFSTGMKNQFPSRAYVDFFAGPGRCVLTDGMGADAEFLGTPLSALHTKDAFSAYHFVEAAPEMFQALQHRAATSDRAGSIHWHGKDANLAVLDVVNALDKNTLTLAIIDPTGLHFHFESLKILTKNRKVDFIYLFPDGMDVRRNLESYLAKESSEVDEVLGTKSWRNEIKHELKRYPAAEDAKCPTATKIVFRVFKQQLEKLGYPYVTQGDDIRFKNSKKADLYYLVFASRHERRHEFWRKVQVIEPSGQRKIQF
jgi:three-Cys-motif partner protein